MIKRNAKGQFIKGSNKLNLIGQRFGQFIIIKVAYIKKDKTYWVCQHNDGNNRILSGSYLVRRKRENKIISIQHKMSKNIFYRRWGNMKNRCLDKKNKRYKDYGGRGITVCNRWLKFENFRDDMYLNYKEHCNKYGENNTQIDRINNNGNYEPTNCKYSTRQQQQNNMRSNKLLTYKGQTLSITQWEKKLNFNRNTIYSRIRRGWSVGKAIDTFVNYKEF